MKKKIKTLKDLEREQEKLKMSMEVTRQEFARKLGTNRKELKSYVLKNVALPLGAASLGVMTMKKVKGNTSTQKNKTSNSSFSWLSPKMISIVLNLVQTYFLKESTQKSKPNHSKPIPQHESAVPQS